MRSRITGRATLPAAVAAASVIAVAVPAVAKEPVPVAQDPAPATVPAQDKECANGLSVLKQIELLPIQADITKTLCTLGVQKSPTEQSQKPQESQQTPPLPPRDYTPPQAAGQPEAKPAVRHHDVADHKNKLLALPAEWPDGLTVWIPTLQNGEWHSYSDSRDKAEGKPVR